MLWPVITIALGIGLSLWIVPQELASVNEQITVFPESDIRGHMLRPYLLVLLFFLPAIAAVLYRFADTLDRYLSKQFFNAFALVFISLLSVWLLMDFQNHQSEFRDSGQPLEYARRFYTSQMPAVIVLILPYALMLSLLLALGRLSRGREIVAMIQTGRGIFRITLPLLVVGTMCSLVCLIFNYHLAPLASGYKDAILDEATQRKASRARSVLYPNVADNREWYVGFFPYDFDKGEPLENILVTTFEANGGAPVLRMSAESAHWDRETRLWEFRGTNFVDLSSRPVPTKLEAPDPFYTDWRESPWQIIKPGLKEENMGIPDLNSWLKENEGLEWADTLPYLTQWHYRWSQPVICLVIIMLATPLGVVFTRRGLGGGVAVAVMLCAGMLFSSTFFLTFGESGAMPPILAAWFTNILFTFVAVYLFRRRITGRPIYQSIKKLLPGGD